MKELIKNTLKKMVLNKTFDNLINNLPRKERIKVEHDYDIVMELMRNGNTAIPLIALIHQIRSIEVMKELLIQMSNQNDKGGN